MTDESFGEPEFDEAESDDPADYDLDADDSWSDVVTCPSCGSDVYEDSVQCPHCGEYVAQSTHPLAGRPWWWIILGLLGIAVTIILLVFV